MPKTNMARLWIRFLVIAAAWTAGMAPVGCGGTISVRDAGTGGTGGKTSMDAGVDAPSGCPAQAPLSGGACQAPLTCTYGQSTCCGQKTSAWTCTCQGGNFSCNQTVQCNFICPSTDGAVAGDVALDASHDSTADENGAGVGAACGANADPSCPDGDYCEWSDNQCGARTHGACAKIPMAVLCVISTSQVCGCDRKNYPGECEAAKAGVDVSSNATCPEPVGMFRCGWRYCTHGAEYCRAQVGGTVTNPGSYSCVPLPAACNGVSSCACVTGSATGCTANANGDVTVTIAVP